MLGFDTEQDATQWLEADKRRELRAQQLAPSLDEAN
jgi:hypothetical protein